MESGSECPERQYSLFACEWCRDVSLVRGRNSRKVHMQSEIIKELGNDAVENLKRSVLIKQKWGSSHFTIRLQLDQNADQNFKILALWKEFKENKILTAGEKVEPCLRQNVFANEREIMYNISVWLFGNIQSLLQQLVLKTFLHFFIIVNLHIICFWPDFTIWW